MDWKALTEKKVFGVPVLYIAALFVVILAVVAWRMQSASEPAAEESAEELAATGDEEIPDVDYSSLATPGTVTVSSPTGVTTTPLPDDNDRWMRRAIEWLAAQGMATADQATIAIQKYLAGDQLSYEEGKLRDAAIGQFGLPPEIPISGGTAPPPTPTTDTPTPTPTTPTPAKYVPPGWHVVTGKSDDGYQEIAKLWYGSAANDRVDLIQAYNTTLPHQGPLKVGTRVWIPKYSPPKYIIAKKGMLTASEIIAKNPPLHLKMLYELNDGMKFPVKAGTKVRVA